ncbi:MAG TPA: MarR family transcriptional regulator [Microlunatus sp.]
MTTPVHVFDRLIEIALLIQDDLARSLPEAGLTVARTHLLWEVHRSGPTTQQSLAAALKVSPRNVTGLVDALETDGFVERRPHPGDRRATLVTLTDLGLQTMADMERDRLHTAARLVADLDAPDLAQLGHALDVVAARLHELVGSPPESGIA